jgi:zinc transporter ZupT
MADSCEWHPSICAAEAAARAAEHTWAAFFASNPWTGAFSATLLISLLPLLLVTLAPMAFTFAKYKNTLCTFAAGAMLGDVCLHILPHALAHDSSSHGHASDSHAHGHHEHEHGHAHGIEDLAGGLAIIAGIMAFLALEKIVRSLLGGHGCGHQHQHEGSGSQKVTSSTKSAKAGKAQVPIYCCGAGIWLRTHIPPSVTCRSRSRLPPARPPCSWAAT